MTITANKGYTLPVVGGDIGTWGNELNNNLTILDNNLGGVSSYALTNSNVTVTNSQAQNLVQKLTGTLTNNVNFILPSLQGFYIIQNNTAGAYQVTVFTTASGSYGFPVAQGVSQQIWTDGTNVYPVGRGLVGTNSTLNLYVSPTGSDSANNGLSPSSPLANMQNAWNVLATRYDGAGGTAQINVADGTYTTGIYATIPQVGFQTINVVGDNAAPAYCLVSVTNAPCFSFSYSGAFSLNLSGFKCVSTGAPSTVPDSGTAVTARDIPALGIGNMEFGACSGYHVSAGRMGIINVTGNYTISGGAISHYIAQNGGIIFANSPFTVTLTGTPTFSWFAYANVMGMIQSGVVFSGSAKGQRYEVGLSGTIDTNNAGASYFPGNTAGAVFANGYYF